MNKVQRTMFPILILLLSLTSCTLIDGVAEVIPVGIDSDVNIDYDLLSIIMARINYEDDDLPESIRLYEESNKVFLNNSAFDLIGIYKDINMISQLSSLSNRIVDSNIKPVSDSDFKNNAIVSVFSKSNIGKNEKYEPLSQYLKNLKVDNLDGLDNSLKRLSFIAGLIYEHNIDLEYIHIEKDLGSLIQYYISKRKGLSVSDSIGNFETVMNRDNRIHNYLKFKELYITSADSKRYYNEAVFLTVNVQDYSLDLAILDSFRSDKNIIKKFRTLFDEKYSKSLNYLKLIYDISDDEKAENISKAFYAIKDVDSYGDVATSNYIISEYIKLNYKKMSNDEIISSYMNIMEDYIKIKTFNHIVYNMVKDDVFDIDLLSGLEVRYNYYVSLWMYDKEMFTDAFKWISSDSVYGDSFSYESVNFIEYSILKLLIIQELNPRLAALESSRILEESDNITDLEIINLHIKVLNGIDIENSIALLLKIKEFDELNFLITSRKSYKVLNTTISNYYYNIGDYKKSIDVINELNDFDYIYFAIIGKNHYKLGYLESAEMNFKKSMDMQDSEFLREVLKDIDFNLLSVE